MLSKTWVAVLLVACVTAVPIESMKRATLKRDPKALVKLSFPGVEEPSDDATEALTKRELVLNYVPYNGRYPYTPDKRGLIPGNAAGAVDKRDPIALVESYIPDVGEPDGDEVETLTKRRLIQNYAEPEGEDVEASTKRALIPGNAAGAVEKRGLIPGNAAGAVDKRDPNNLVLTYIPFDGTLPDIPDK